MQVSRSHDVDHMLAADGPLVAVILTSAGKGRRLRTPSAYGWGRGGDWDNKTFEVMVVVYSML